jgi:3-hydroxyacyl-CoA dehydrogenase
LEHALSAEPIRAGVVGSGTMGTGIAAALANAGGAVTVVDADPSALERSRAGVDAIFQSAVDRGRIDETARDARRSAITFSTDLGALHGADVAIEAVYEDLDLKRAVFARLSEVCGERTLLATNTSTLDIDAVGGGVRDPQRMLGLHFFSPAHIMKLVEIVRGTRTSPEAIAQARDLVERLGKIGVVVASCDGFVGNRMLLRYRREAELLLEEGATPEQVDGALRAFGFAMGPFAVSDLAGLDIAYRAKQERLKRGGLPFRQSRIPDRLVEGGRLGQKTGAGYFRYERANRSPLPDDEVLALIADERARLGVRPRPIPDSEIVERTLLALFVEGRRIVGEGIASSEDDIDTIWRHGYGFPAAKGGPMTYHRALDAAAVDARIAELAARDPAFWGGG